ncbi:MAG: nucleotidyltransferase substrate binding protein [Bacteroidia bacterium]|nr:nucleotidyltransferase substrate binding protein [Bacteroidia bacterium]
MTEQKDIRWRQRFNNFIKALSQLTKFIEKGKNLNELEEQGMIKAFEYTFELAWNTIKDFYESQGETGLQGSRDTLRLAFKRELIKDGENWMNMIESRIKTTHTYNEEQAKEIADFILNIYYHLFVSLKSNFEKIIDGQIELFDKR